MNTKGHCYPKSIIVYFKLRFTVDYATIQRWVYKFSPFIKVQMKKRKLRVGTSWRMDETDIKV